MAQHLASGVRGEVAGLDLGERGGECAAGGGAGQGAAHRRALGMDAL